TVILTYNSGNPLTVDNYTLFVRGDKVFDLAEAGQTTPLALAQAQQLIVANGFAGANPAASSISVVKLPGDGPLGTLSDYRLPSQGTTPANTFAVASGDLDGVGGNDLVVVNAGTNTVSIFQNRNSSKGYGFDLNADATLLLPTGDVNQFKQVLVADFNNDG